jgi:hypothetical protein
MHTYRVTVDHGRSIQRLTVRADSPEQAVSRVLSATNRGTVSSVTCVSSVSLVR